MKTNIIVFLFVIVGFSCKKQTGEVIEPSLPQQEITEFVQFKFQAKDNSQQLLKDVTCRISEEKIAGVMSYVSSSKNIIASFKINGAEVRVNNVIQESGVTSNDFSKPVTYTIIGTDNRQRNYTVTLYSFTGLPVLYLQTEGPVVSKDDYVAGNMIVDPNSRYDQTIRDIKLKVKGRGNSTWDMPKKPYKLKFDQKTEMLGMPAAKEWVLLANFADKTLIRNYVAFEIANRFDVNFTPRSRFVEVFMNSEYIGNYLLADQVEIGKDRVNIQEMTKNDNASESITGGYLLEVDARLDEVFWFKTSKNVPFTIKSPKDITPKQFDYIKNYVQQTEDALYSDSFADPVNGYAKFINTETFIDWYLVNELLKNADATFYSSVFLYKDRNNKLCIGPVWDFDLAFGNYNSTVGSVSISSPEDWLIRQSLWINRLFDDPAFKEKVRARWKTLKLNELPGIYTFINETSSYLQYSQKENFKKWDVLYNYTWPNAASLGSYQNEVQYLKDWLLKRVNWLDNEFAKQQF